MTQQDDMHPEDKRNLIIFILLAVGVWLLFDAYLLKPKLNELKEQHKIEQEQRELAPELSPEARIAAKQETRKKIIAQAQRIKIENSNIFGTLSTKGGIIDDIALTEYFEELDSDKNVTLMEPKGGLNPRYMDMGWLSTDHSVALPEHDTVWSVRSESDAQELTPDNPVTLFWDNGQGLTFERQLSIDDKYVVTVKQRVINDGDASIVLHPYALLAQHGLPRDQFGRWIVHEGPIGYMGDELIELSYKKMQKKGIREVKASDGWIGITERYWFTGLIPADSGESYKFRFIHKTAGEQEGGRYQVDKTGDGMRLEPGSMIEDVTYLYVGPKELLTVQDYEKSLSAKHFDLIIDFGIWYFIAKPFFYLLHFIYSFVGNYGFAIVIFTLIVRAAAFPLNNVSYRSFAKLKKIGPRMKELREEYKEDKEGLQKELVKLYEKEQVNPLSGCLPILVQIPVFFALYKVLLISIEMRHEPFIGWINDLSAPDPTTVVNLFGLLPIPTESVPAFFMIGAWPCFMLFFMLLQRRLHPPPTDPMQKGLMDAMPFMVCFVLSKFAAGLVIYWTFSNAFSVLQQYIIMRRMGIDVSFIHGNKGEKEDFDGPVVHPGAGVVKDHVEKALFDDPLEIEKDGNDDEPKEISAPKPKKKKKKK